MWLSATFEDIERISYQMEILNESSIKAIVDGRKPNCNLCSKRGHMRIQYPQRKPKQMEREKE